MKPFLLLIATVAVLAAAVAPFAGAADKPAPCDGKLQAKDPAGDQTVGFAGNQTPVPADASTDATGLFFYRTADGATTANLTIADLKNASPSGSQGLVYRFFYTVGTDQHYLEVDAGGGAPSYSYGHIDTTLTNDGDTSGQFVEGKDGVVSIKVPPAAGGKVGVKFTDAYAFTAYDEGAVLAAADFVPDGDDRVTWGGEVCAASGSATPEPTGPSGPSGPSGPTGPSGNPDPVAGSGPLAISVSPKKLKAKKKAKSVTFKLTSREDLTKLSAKFAKGAKKAGTAKLAKLAANTTGKLKVKLKGLKKGKYKLSLSARRANNTTGKLTVKITVK